MLVGKNGYSPISYFDSLEQSEVTTSSASYYDENSTLSNNYYIVKPKIASIFGAYSSGSSTLTLFGDYVNLANQGVLYAYVQTGIVADNQDKNKITISLAHNGQTLSTTNTQTGGKDALGYYMPHYYKTDKVKVVSNSNITFSYTNNTKSSVFSSASFQLFKPSIQFETLISEVAFSNQDSTIYHGDVVKLNATNSILEI